MTITVSLLITFATVLLFGGWILAAAIRHAEDAYEDAHGFNLGSPPAQSVSLALPQAGPVKVTASVNAPAFVPVHSATDTTAHAVTIFVSGTARAASALYRRHHRSGNSSASFPVLSTPSTGSASPFAIQCAATRARANQADSASPFTVSAKSVLGDGAGL